MILQLVLHNNHNIFMALQSSCGCNILHEALVGDTHSEADST